MASNNSTANFSDISQRWLALQQRDPSANSAFFYGVDSTRIFCRPNCPGRLARRANIAFFDDVREAQNAGYRPCQRCEPCNEKWRVDQQSRIIFQKASKLITKAIQEEAQWKVQDIATEIGTSPGHLHRLFKRFANTTPRAYAETTHRAFSVSQSGPCRTPCQTSSHSIQDITEGSEPASQLYSPSTKELAIEENSRRVELAPFDERDVGMVQSPTGTSHMRRNMVRNGLEIGEVSTYFDPGQKSHIEETYVFWDMDWSQERGPFISGVESVVQGI